MSDEPSTFKAQLVEIANTCFVCSKTYTAAQKLRLHFKKHRINVSERPVGIRRHDTPSYSYVKADGKHPDIQKHFGCLSCSAHFKLLNDLEDHFNDDHPESMPPAPQHQESNDVPSKKRSVDEIVDVEDVDTELMDHSCLSIIPPCDDDRLMVGDFDATNAFYNFQRSLLGHKWKFSLEDHVQYALASTSILFLSRNQYPEDFLPFFDEHNLKATIDRVDAIYDIKKPRMPTNVVMEIIKIIEDLLSTATTREEAAIKLLGLDLATHEYKFAKAIAELVKKLPRVSLAEESNEMELCSRYVDPFLCGIFDEPDEGVFVRWTNETTLEAKKQQSLLSWRPDICITSLQGIKWKANIGFGKAKPAHQGSNHYSVGRDLLRVAVFCKNALDTQKMKGIMSLQIVGRTITFYVLVLPSSGLYIMHELAKIKIPDCLNDLPKLVTDISDVLLVLDVFNRICIPSVDSPHPPTISSSIFNQLFSTSQNRT
ncbi:hypothetical protein PS15p_201130 [Mucor circinelloides]